MSSATTTAVHTAPPAPQAHLAVSRAAGRVTGARPVFQLPAIAEKYTYHKGRQVDAGRGFQQGQQQVARQGQPNSRSSVANAKQQQAQQSGQTRASGTLQQTSVRGQAVLSSQNAQRGNLAENVAAKRDAGVSRELANKQALRREGKAQMINKEQFVKNTRPSGTNIALNGKTIMVAPTTVFGKSTGSDAPARSNAEQQVNAHMGDDAASQGRKRWDGEDQGRHTEQAGLRSATQMNARFAPTSAQQSASNAVQVEIVAKLMTHMEQMRQSGRGAMLIELPVPGGKTVRISLRMNGNRISARIDTPNENIYKALNNGWANLAEQAATRGIRLDAPSFTRNNHSDLLEDELTL